MTGMYPSLLRRLVFLCLSFSLLPLSAMANQAPVCANAYASPSVIWPPSHAMVPISIDGVTDPDGDSLVITSICVMQDEPLNAQGDGNTAIDASGVGSGNPAVRAERSGKGNGRVYHIDFVAQDPAGAACMGSAIATVPHSKKKLAVDGGRLFPSTSANINCSGETQNRPPEADDQTVTTMEDQSVSIVLDASDPDGDALAISMTSDARHGRVEGEYPDFVYVPDLDFYGLDTFSYTASDGSLSSPAATVTILVAPVNDPPVAGAMTVEVQEDESITFELVGTDVDNTELVFSLVSVPEHGSLSIQGGQAHYNPDQDYFGADSFSYLVSDGESQSSPAQVDIVVVSVNDIPVIASSPILSGKVDQQWSYAVSATDVDSETLSWMLLTAPDGMFFSPVMNTLFWSPQDAQSGLHQVTLSATDEDGGQASQSFWLDVARSSNTPPRIITNPPREVMLGNLYSYGLEATDQEDAYLTYSLVSYPEGMQISPLLGSIGWRPRIDQVGSHPVTVRVTDSGGAQVEQSWWIRVDADPTNQQPMIVSSPSLTAVASVEYTYQVVAEDPDGDTVSVSLNSAPAGMQIDAAGLISWQPDRQERVLVFVQADDGKGGVVDQQYHLDVSADNTPPVIVSLPRSSHTGSATFNSSNRYRYQAVAIDEEQDPVTFALVSAPAGATIDPNTGLVLWNFGRDEPYLLNLRTGVYPQCITSHYDIEIEEVRPVSEDGSILVDLINRGGVAYAGGDNIVITASLRSGGTLDQLAVLPALPPGARHTVKMNARASDIAARFQVVVDDASGGDCHPSSNLRKFTVFELSATDIHGQSDTQAYVLSISDVNRPPVFLSRPPLLGSDIDGYRYDVRASDPEGDYFNVFRGSNTSDVIWDAQSRTLQMSPQAARSAVAGFGEVDNSCLAGGDNSQRLSLDSWQDYREGGTHGGVANWVLDADSLGVTLLQNADPSYLLTPYEVMDGAFRINVVPSSGDDDVVGFVWGFKDQSNYYRLAWDGGGQCNGNCIKVEKVSQVNSEYISPTNPDREVLYAGNIESWDHSVNYSFDIKLQAGQIRIQLWNRDEEKLITAFSLRDGGYVGGKFGPYVHSQDGTYFTVERIEEQLLPDLVSVEVLYDDSSDAGSGLSVAVMNRGSVDVLPGVQVGVVARNNRGNASAADVAFPAAYTSKTLAPGDVEVVYVGELVVSSLHSTYAINVNLDQADLVAECKETNNFVSYRAVDIRTQDGSGFGEHQRYAITIRDLPERPVIAPVDTQYAASGRLYQFLPDVVDPDTQDRHEYVLLSGPDDAFFSPETGALIWQPSNDAIGNVLPVSIQVTDLSGHQEQVSFDLTVHAAPVILSQPLRVAPSNGQYTYVVEGLDPDGGPVSYHLLKGPVGSEVDADSGVLTWSGYASSSLGSFVIAVRDDEGEETFQAFRVGVALASGENRPPVITPIDDMVMDIDLDVRIQMLSFTVMATDADGHALAYELLRAPAGMIINPATGLINWRPATTQLGTHPVRVRVYDYHGGEAEEEFQITVIGSGGNRPPVFEVLEGPLVAAREQLVVDVPVTDPDGDPVSYRLLSGPAGISINQASGVLRWQPYEQHIGDHVVEIQATDSAGASAILLLTVRVGPANTTAPEVQSDPLVFAYIGQQYIYQIQATDAEGDALHYDLSQGPEGLTVDASGRITFFPMVDQIGVHQVSVRISDGRFDSYHAFPLQVIAASANTPPLVLSQPERMANVGSAYTYAIEARDAEGDMIYYALRSAPPGMTIDPVGVLRWQPEAWDLGVHDVAVLVTDAQGAVTRHSWRLETFDNGSPLITSTPVTGAVVGRDYEYQVTAVDPEGAPIHFSLPVAPSGMSISAGGLIQWQPDLATTEERLVTVRASDGQRYIEQTYSLYVDAQAAPLAVSLSGDRRYYALGEQASITAIPLGGQPPYSLQAWLDSEPVLLTEGNLIELDFVEIGAYTLRVVVVDDAGAQAETEMRLAVSDGTDSEAPNVVLTSPGWDQRITAPVMVTGTVTDTQLAEWSLVLRRPRSSESQLLASGVTGLQDAVLAELDPTMLMNGLYELVLTATDYSGQTSSTAVTVVVDGNLKVGQFSFTLEDLSIPMAGIPVRVTRTYDSRRRHESLDFGHGWSVGYQDVLIDETSEPSQGWRQYQSFEVFTINGSNTVFRGTCTVPLFNKQVAVTLPDGKVERFDVRAEAIGGGVGSSSNPDCSLTASRYFNLVFVPDSQTHSQLQASGTESLYLASTSAGDLVVDVSETRGRDINRYTLTTREGYRYELDQSFGIRRVTDPNGHTLDYTDNGIFHSAGKSILFERDSLGRIVRITDPAGQQRHYGFNSLGDLISATDQAGHASTYSYHGRSHLLDEMQDPLGRRLLRNLYDDNGRLIAQEDNQGNRTDFNHDVAGRQSVVTDRRGNVSLFYYDDRGNVTGKVDAAGQLWQYTFDADDNPLTETNPLGERSESTFNEQGDQLTAKDALGNVTRFAYNARGQETRIEDAKGNAFDNSYDSVGNLLSITDPQGNVASNEMLASGLVASTTDLAGQTTRYTYDTAGNKLTETDPLGNVSSWTYDANGNVLTESISRIHDGESRTETTAYEYDALNRVIAVTDALGNVTRTEYDAAGNEVAQVDALGRRTEMTYDAYGRVISTRYPDDTTISSRYDAEGNLVEETDRLGRTTVMTYDPLNRLTETRYPDGSTRTTEYDAAGRVIAEVDALGQRTRYEYDAAGRRTAVINALEQRHSFEYDANGNLLKETDANGHETRYSYNSLDQRVSTRFHDGSTVSDEYDALSRKTASVDQNGTRTEYDYDALGRLTAVRQFLNGAPLTTLYSYDSQGNKLTQTDAEGRTTRWEYDALGRVTARILPLGQRETFEYDANGNQTRHTDFNGQLTTSEYDALNRLVRRSYEDGTQEAWTYDAAGRVIETTLTANGLPQVTHYQYDQQDRLTREAKPDGSVLEYSYDLNGNKTSVTVTPAGGSPRTVSYSYDALSRLATATDEHGTTTYTYTPAGSRASVTQANGVITSYSYDSLNRLTQLTSRASNGTVLQQYDYTLDASGRRTRISEHNGRVSEYRYDDLYRLTEETITDPVNGNHSARYSYDTVGNRLESTVNGQITSYSYDGNDRILSQGDTTYSYDANGNTLTESSSSGTTSYSWDARNRLIEATTPNGSLLFGYDINGIRTSRSEGGITTNFVVDHNQQYAQVLAEIENGFTIKQYTYGDDLLSQTEGAGQERFFLYDGLGTTRALADGAEAVTDAYVYEAFGELLASTGSSGNAYRYTGEQYDSGLDQYYLRARYYDQGVGRFTQMDTWMGRSNQPVTLNKYLYANADPVRYVDPSGRSSLIRTSTAIASLAVLTTASISAYQIGQSLAGESPDGFRDSDLGWLTIAGMVGAGSSLHDKIREKVDSRSDSRNVITLWRAVEDAELASMYTCDCFALGPNMFPKQFFHTLREAEQFGYSGIRKMRPGVGFHVVSGTISVALYQTLDHSAYEPNIGPIVTVSNGLLPAFNFEVNRNGGWKYQGSY